jgi:hypothetical protein
LYVFNEKGWGRTCPWQQLVDESQGLTVQKESLPWPLPGIRRESLIEICACPKNEKKGWIGQLPCSVAA